MKDNEIEGLIKVLETTQNYDSLWKAAESLEKIDPGNPKAIEALIKVLETSSE
jgi:HEAT repeat protein